MARDFESGATGADLFTQSVDAFSSFLGAFGVHANVSGLDAELGSLSVSATMLHHWSQQISNAVYVSRLLGGKGRVQAVFQWEASDRGVGPFRLYRPVIDFRPIVSRRYMLGSC